MTRIIVLKIDKCCNLSIHFNQFRKYGSCHVAFVFVRHKSVCNIKLTLCKYLNWIVIICTFCGKFNCIFNLMLIDRRGEPNRCEGTEAYEIHVVSLHSQFYWESQYVQLKMSYLGLSCK